VILIYYTSSSGKNKEKTRPKSFAALILQLNWLIKHTRRGHKKTANLIKKSNAFEQTEENIAGNARK
jgi:hypothetical protein